MSEAGTGDADRGQLLGIFSAEVWLHILRNVKDAKDFQRISDASAYLGTLLQPRATQVLFPEVLQILIQQQPPLFTSPVELVHLRQVCHAWEFGVEQALQDPEYPFLFEREQWEKIYRMQSQPTYIQSHESNDKFLFYDGFTKKEDYAKFHQHFGATEAAVAATRKNTLFFCQDVMFDIVRLQDHFTHCLEFLQTYGAQIWYFFLHLNFVEAEQHGQFYSSDRLQQILALMPNLRTLHFVDLRLSHDLEEPPRQQLLQSVELSMAATPLPELKQLQMITVTGIPLPFLRALVQKNPQVRHVSDVSRTSRENHVSVYMEQMPNLIALELKLNNLREFEAFRMAPLHCQLSKLHLSIRWARNEGEYLWKFAAVARPLFRVLETRFSTTLTELDLKFHCPPDDSEEQGPELQLPQLKKLAVTFRDYLISLDFVLPLKDTQEEMGVEVQMDYYGRTRSPFEMDEAMTGDKTVKLYQFWREPEKSNVWTLFPKLKALRMRENEEMYSCTWDDWIAQQPSN